MFMMIYQKIKEKVCSIIFINGSHFMNSNLSAPFYRFQNVVIPIMFRVNTDIVTWMFDTSEKKDDFATQKTQLQ